MSWLPDIVITLQGVKLMEFLACEAGNVRRTQVTKIIALNNEVGTQ